MAWVGQQVGWGRAHRVSRSPLWYTASPSCRLCGRGPSRGTMASASTSAWEKLPPSITLMPDIPFSSPMSLVPCELLSQHWSSEPVSQLASKFMLEPFKRNAWDSSTIYKPQSLLVFIPRNYADFSSWHWKPGLRGPGVELRPLIPQRGSPQPRYTS